MANKLYNESDIQAIANAIRNKGGASSTMTVSQMATAIGNIPSGGGGGGDGIYLVETIAERNAIQNPQAGDICVVYSQTLAPITNPPVAGVATFPNSVTLSTEVQEEEYYAISCSNYDDYCMFDINLSRESCSLNFETDMDWYSVEYTTSDGIHYTKSSGISTFTLPSGTWNVNNFDSICANFMLVNSANLIGMYEYKNNTWYYLDIGIYADENKMFAGTKAYTSTGIVEGALDSKAWNPLMYKIGTELPEDVDMANQTFLLVDENIEQNLLDYNMKNNCPIIVTEDDVRNINVANYIDNVTGYLLQYQSGLAYTKIGTKYYVIKKSYQQNGEFYSIDLPTGTKTVIQSNINTSSFTMVLNEDDNSTIYYSIDSTIYSYDTTLGTSTSLKNVGSDITGIAYDDGKIYYETSSGSYYYDISNDTISTISSSILGKYSDAVKTRYKVKIGQGLYYCVGAWSESPAYVLNINTLTGYKATALGESIFVKDNTIYSLNGGVIYAIGTDFTYYTSSPTPYGTAYSCDSDIHVVCPCTIYSYTYEGRGKAYTIAPDTNGDIYVGGYNGNQLYKITNFTDLYIAWESRNPAYILVKKSKTNGYYGQDYTHKNALYYYQNLAINTDDIDVVAISGKLGEATPSWLKKVYIGNLDNNSWALFKDYDPQEEVEE